MHRIATAILCVICLAVVDLSAGEDQWPKFRGLNAGVVADDPALASVQNSTLPSPVAETLVAAAIEVGLVSSTHVIALHTDISHLSKWIPYEFGRAKERGITSTQACSYFDPVAAKPVAGEYTFLAARVFSDTELEAWLDRQQGPGSAP